MSSNTTFYGLSRAAESFLKFVLQFGHHNPRWPPKWPQKYLTFNLDGLESHIIPLCRGYQVRKPIPEVGVAIRLT